MEQKTALGELKKLSAKYLSNDKATVKDVRNDIIDLMRAIEFKEITELGIE